MNAKHEAETERLPTATQRIEDENIRMATSTMPGQRADLAKGTLPKPLWLPQSDENRDQPIGPDGKPTLTSKPPLTD